ncbi:endonuclease domain-containing protein [Terrabacter sp. 2TAF16]|uniref:endonuclease domain-containing protein n=1 Tax=Terrabacter sp. 2TAF16 TaxID=3233008 RepID=UPI003F9E7991
MRAVTALVRLGGTATRRQLRLAVHWRHIDAALGAGLVVRTSHGHYCLAGTDAARAAAHRLSAAASHTTAAQHWGWKVRLPSTEPHVTVRSKRSLPTGASDGVIVHWRDLDPDDVTDGWVTTPVRTVIDCCLDLPFDEALAVADSALRSGLGRGAVVERAAWLGPRQRSRVARVMGAADRRAANPFESVLRAIAQEVAGLVAEPQTRIRYDDFYARVDLADEALRIVLEADSHEFHTERRAFDRDCRRYNGLITRDWLVLRFTWEQVMFEPEVVRRAIEDVVVLRRSQGIRRLRTGRVTGTRSEKAS